MKEESKVEPFYIKYEEWMRTADVVVVLDKAISCGAILDEGIYGHHNYYDSGYLHRDGTFKLFGVNSFGDTYLCDIIDGFGKDAVEITLDQVDDHLGLIKVDKSANATPQSLVGCKIDLRNEDGSVNSELSAAFQEACFSQGLKWRRSGSVTHCDKPFLYVDDDYLGHGTEHVVFLEDSNKEVKFEFERKLNWSVKYMSNETTRKTVEIGGVSYYEDKLLEAVQLLESAKVVDSGVATPMAGGGVPPDRPLNMQ